MPLHAGGRVGRDVPLGPAFPIDRICLRGCHAGSDGYARPRQPRRSQAAKLGARPRAPKAPGSVPGNRSRQGSSRDSAYKAMLPQLFSSSNRSFANLAIIAFQPLSQENIRFLYNLWLIARSLTSGVVIEFRYCSNCQ